MAKKPLRSQLNQIRGWVRQGRTDAWIAHQLDVATAELIEFRRRHELSPDDDSDADTDLRDEIEAEIEATMDEEPDPADEPDDEPEEGEGEEGEGDKDEPAPRRRRRRGGRGRGKRAGVQGSFDHGEHDGFGLWLDPAIGDDPIYVEHWAGHRQIEVTIEADRIVIKRSDAG